MRVFSKFTTFFLIILPDLAIFYLSLFLTIQWRYQNRLSPAELMTHVRLFSVIYLLWLVIFYAHNLFDLTTFRRYTTQILSLVSATAVNFLLTASYFYFQPSLILTPRRFLILHIALTFCLVLIWHLIVKQLIKQRFLEYIYLFSFAGELN
jgi:hypothetical protein